MRPAPPTFFRSLAAAALTCVVGATACDRPGLTIPSDPDLRPASPAPDMRIRPSRLTRHSTSQLNDVEPTLGPRFLAWRQLWDPTWGNVVVRARDNSSLRTLPGDFLAYSFSDDWVVGLGIRNDRPLFSWVNVINSDIFDLPPPPDAQSINSFELRGDWFVVSYNIALDHDAVRVWSLTTKTWSAPLGDAPMARSARTDGTSLVWLQNRNHHASHSEIAWDAFSRPIDASTPLGRPLAPSGDYNEIFALDAGAMLARSRSESIVSLTLRDLTSNTETRIWDEPRSVAALTSGASLTPTWVAFTANAAGPSDLMVTRRADEKSFLLTSEPGTQSRSPSVFGDVVAFSDNRTGDFDIYTIELTNLDAEDDQ